jgi:hypothetical protein
LFQGGSKSESSLVLASTSHQDRVFPRDSQQAGKKATYNVFAYSSGRLHKSKFLAEQHHRKSISYIPYEMMYKKWQYHLLKMLRENVSDPAIEKDIDRAWRDYPKGFVAFLQDGDVPPGGKGLAQYLAKYVVSPPISVRRIESYDGKVISY